MPKQDPERVPNSAAVYVRMSTEHQQYSTSNQMDAIRDFAKRRGLEIVKDYSDEGKSGLNIQGRDSLAQMIRDVESGQATYSCILVYDVSRWGRFQDADESAYYEYICRRAGVAVHYCAEQFENDGSPVSTIVKGVKRAMAGEYSRELSSKVFQGACRLIQLGFKQGGTAGFGLRRMLIDQAGQQKATLKMGEQKSLQTDRVILVPGPPEEVELVRWMYREFVDTGKPESEIAAALNVRGVVTDFGRAWPRNEGLRQIVVQATNPRGRVIQVSVLTDDQKGAAGAILKLMFGRWVQENDFKVRPESRSRNCLNMKTID